MRLTGFAMLLVTLSILAASVVAYRLNRRQVEQYLGDGLLRIVLTAAPLVNADLLPMIYLGEDGQIRGKEEFAELRDLLKRVEQANGLTSSGSPVYILRPVQGGADASQLEFVVTTQPDRDGRWPVGNLYPAQPHNLKALEGQASASMAYRDAEGAWISASAPLKSSDGRVVAILQADRPIDFLDVEARSNLAPLLVTAICCLAAASVLSALIARSLAGPVQNLVQAIQEIAQGGLSHRVKVDRNDELGDLAASVNQMAAQLGDAHAGLVAREKELNSALRAAEAANRAKGQFLASVSHELRTPLNGVLGFSSLLLDGQLDEEQREYAQAIEDSATGLLHLLTGVLDYTSADPQRVTWVPFDPVRLAEDITEGIGADAARKGLDLILHLDPALPRSVTGDEVRLRQVLNHLAGNAVKFTTEGEVVVRVLGIRGPQFELRLEVRDTGIGIERDQFESIFEPFVQADGTSTRKHGGMGLGLALCRRIANFLGGQIGLESQPGEGSTFWFQVPMIHAEEHTFQVPMIHAEEHTAPPAVTAGLTLIAVNSKAAAKAYGLTLDAIGVREHDTCQPADAVARLLQARSAGIPFAAVLADAGPATLSLMREIRGQAALSSMPLVGAWHWQDRPPDSKLRQIGRAEAVTKPLRQARLAEAWERATGRTGALISSLKVGTS
jgi:signal transduction histidine kinase